MQVRHEADGGGDDEEVFDDVLSFKCWHKRCLPCCRGKEDERKHGREHMKEKEWEGNALCLWDKEEDTDDTFEGCKEGIEDTEIHKVNRLIKEVVHKPTSW